MLALGNLLRGLQLLGSAVYQLTFKQVRLQLQFVIVGSIIHNVHIGIIIITCTIIIS